MQLRVRATGRCGAQSDRSASDKSVRGIVAPGSYWAVDAKVENALSNHLREGAIVRYWGTRQHAEADAMLISRGLLSYKDTGLRYFDPVITSAEAYWR